jgi:hypothetical protein
MATKKPATIKATEKPSQGADDLQILHPEKTAVIAGTEITCREYAFIEELELRPLTQPIIDGMIDLLNSKDFSDRELDLLIANNIKAAQQLMAISAGVEVEFVRSLNQADGRQLYALWWGVCGPFFVTCAKDYVVSKRMAAAQRLILAKKMADGQTSMQPLSHTGTIPAESEATLTDN